MTEQTTQAPDAPDRGFEEGNERLARLLQRRGAAERVGKIRKEMREADRLYAMNIAAIRKAAEQTQTEVADRLGVGQSVVSRTERSNDMLLSTLASYLAATGVESASIVVRVHGVDVELDLFEMQQKAP